MRSGTTKIFSLVKFFADTPSPIPLILDGLIKNDKADEL